ncbi:MAG: patatin-like phospholipase family protein [Gammaproteobacteria bacterium]|nr:MAG: patatin-like phospholipase family protein [Gammaproteobacteria bacterium]
MNKLILSLDGGGIRGAATSQFLMKVEKTLFKQHKKRIRDCVDFYAGTSTGSIIALALATTKLTIEEINKLYSYSNAKIIFTENEGWFEIDGVNAPKYEASGKTRLLKQKFEKARISDVPDGKHVLAVTYGIERRKPVIFKSTDDGHKSIFSFQVADASSAAPTYFPTTNLTLPPDNDEYWLIDGGVIANNPTMCAIAEAKHVWDGISIDDIHVLSIGTGYQTRKINGPESKKWGKFQWMTKGNIIDVLSDERVVDYQARTILKDGNYIRINAELRTQEGLPNPPDDAMDDISKNNIKKLKALGDFWFKKCGAATVAFLAGQYDGPSLKHIHPQDGSIS